MHTEADKISSRFFNILLIKSDLKCTEFTASYKTCKYENVHIMFPRTIYK